MNKDINKIKNKEILFLQGPMGNYFKKQQLKLLKNNTVFRIGFNKGDEFFALNCNFYPFRFNPNKWKHFINSFLIDKKINIIFLFGDCRYYHKIAIEEAKRLNIDCYVYEEGYIRPNYITLEKNGVNYFSEIINNQYEILNEINTTSIDLNKLENNFVRCNTFFKMVFESFVYYLISNLYNFQYPYYIHHREFFILDELKYAIFNLYRLIKNYLCEHNFEKVCKNQYKNKYFFVPLQTHNDFQVKVHSKYDSIEEFIKEVLISFSKFSGDDKLIFLKHHPVDRGRKNYYKFISCISSELNIKPRVKILYDVHLPTLLKYAIGTIVINSSVGLSSLHHKTPVLSLGKAVYDIGGLTVKNINHRDFWNAKSKVNSNFYMKFRTYLIDKTQINDHFYN